MEKQLSVSSGNESRKRRNEDSENESDEQEDALSADAIAQMTRSERKRHREKKRRSDVNKGFDDLTSLLWEIDPTMRVEAEERATRLQTKGQSVGPPEAALLSRVDLISRATQLLRRLHHENEQNKNIISALTRQGLIGSSVVSDLANLNRLAGQRNLDGSSQMNDELVESLRQPFLGSSRLLHQSAAFESSPTYNQSLMDRLVSAQAASSRLNAASSQDLLYRLAAQNALSQRSLMSYPSSLSISMGGRAGIDAPNVCDSSASLIRNTNLNMAGLSEQQLRLQLSNMQSGNNNANFIAAMSGNRNIEQESADDVTRNLLRMLQERQAAAAASHPTTALNLADADALALLQQRPGAGNESSRR